MGQVDINDLYAFQSPDNAANSVLILTVNPGAGALSPTDFATDSTYEIRIDNTTQSNNANGVTSDITYQATFAGSGAAQTVSITRNGQAICCWSDGHSPNFC